MADAEAGTSAKEALTLSYAELAKLKPCSDARARAKAFMGNRRMNAAEAREAGAKLDDIVWVASSIARNNPDVDRRLHLWLADCAAHVLHIYERTESSPAPRNAIIASRQFARGEIDDAARVAAWVAARDAARDAAWVAAWAAARDAARVAARVAAWDAEETWQFDRLILWISADEPSDWPLPALAEKQAA